MAQVHWFGSLTAAASRRVSSPAAVTLDGPAPLDELLERLEIPPELVQLVMINHRAVARDTLVRPGDRVALFPREYPFFVDWKDFRRA